MIRQILLVFLILLSPRPALSADTGGLAPAVEKARALPRLNALIVAREGRILVERAFRGPGLDQPVNVKSVSKALISALVGRAIAEGVIAGVDTPIRPLLAGSIPAGADPRLDRITVGHLLSMQAGLERTSGPNYGRWVSSGNWVAYALSRPFVEEPGGPMLYSTGSTHLLSAILSRASARSTLDLAREWLGEPLDINIPAWERDPQGIFMGGNNMALSPRALLRFGEMYREKGRVDGREVLPEAWIRASWTPRTTSRFTGHGYGYGWFITDMAETRVYYAWGHGGQMLYVVPAHDLTVVMTSTPGLAAGYDGYVRDLHRLLEDDIIAALD